MNSNSTLRWLVPLCTFLALLIPTQQTVAQCSISYTPPSPVEIVLQLDAAGNVTLDASTVAPAIGYSGTCTLYFSDDNFATKSTTVPFDCGDLTFGAPLLDWKVRAENINPANNSAIIGLAIYVEDAILPQISAPSDLTVQTSDDGNGDCFVTGIVGLSMANTLTLPLNDGEYFDNCPLDVTVSYFIENITTGDTLSGTGLDVGAESFEAGEYVITYKIYDASGNFASDDFSLTVEDDEPPTIACPTIPAVLNASSTCEYTFVTGAEPIINDNCTSVGNLILTNSETGTGDLNGYSFPLGVTNVTYTVEDAYGLIDVCNFSVNVEDNTNPVIACPASDTVYASAFCDYSISGGEFDPTSFSDNCAGVTISNDYNGGSTLDTDILPLGATTIVWTAEDGNLNTASCSLTVTVQDTTPPVVTLAPPTLVNYVDFFSVNVALNACTQSVTFYRPSYLTHNASDNCGSPVTITEGTPIVNGVPTPSLFNGVTPFPYDYTNLLHTVTPITVQFPVDTTLIPYYFTDTNGNVDTIYITVVVKENEKPVAKCQPGIITLPLSATNPGTATLTAAMINNGSTDNCGIDTITVSPNTFACSPTTNQIVTLTVTDDAGNTSTCTATIKVVDNNAPQTTCLTNVSVSTDANVCYATNVPGVSFSAGALTAPGRYLDNCGVTVVSYAITGATTAASPLTGINTIPASQQFNTGNSTVTYIFKDAAGNQSVCSFNVTVADLVGPFVTNAGPNILIQAPVAGSTITQNANTGGCLSLVNWVEPVFIDACSPANGAATLVSRSNAPGSFFPFGNTLVTYVFRDAVGNLTTYSFTILIVDTQAPVAKCRPTLTINLPDVPPANPSVSIIADSIDNTSTDNCFFSRTIAPSIFDCSNLGNNTVVLTVTDGQGNARTCSTTVVVKDVSAPHAICTPGVLTLPLTAGGTASLAAATINGGSFDNCTTLTASNFDASRTGVTFTTNVLFDCTDVAGPDKSVILRVKDASGNTATCTKLVKVVDNIFPTATAPADITITCGDALPTTVPTFADNCGTPTLAGPVVTTMNGACPIKQIIKRTWTVTDASANTTTVTQTITVRDLVKPVFSTVSNITVGSIESLAGGCGTFLFYELTADSVKDNCSSFAGIDILLQIDYPAGPYSPADITNAIAYDPAYLEFFPIGQTIVTFTAYDECGNSASQTLTVQVNDVLAPIFSNFYQTTWCDSLVSLVNTNGACSNTFTWERPGNIFGDIDECYPALPLSSFVRETFKDPAGNTVPISTVPFNFFSNNPVSLFPTAQFPVGKTIITYTAKDAANNTSSCSFTIEVKDVQAPTLTCPQNQTLFATCPTALVPDYRSLVQITDNCPGGVVLTQSWKQGAGPVKPWIAANLPGATNLDTVFTTIPAVNDVFTVVISGNDLYNSGTCSFTVTLQDGDDPIPTVATLPLIESFCGMVTLPAPTANDPCNAATPTIYGTPSTPVAILTMTNPPTYKLVPGQYVITWVYNDGNGNISTQPQNISIAVDTFKPKALCFAALTLPLDNTGAANLTIPSIDSASFDQHNCGPLTLSLNTTSFNCSNIGVNNVILSVKDINNNIAQCTTKVTVKDLIAPALVNIPANITVESCTPIPTITPAVTATDICDATVAITLNATSTKTSTGLGQYNYTITRVWRATDDSGNTTTASQVVTVNDTKPPVFAANAPTYLSFTTTGNNTDCKATAKYKVSQYVTDCATGVDLKVRSVPAGFSLSDSIEVLSVGLHTFIFIAKDTTGNTSQDTVVIEIKDGTSPVAACINGISVALQSGGTVPVTSAQVDANSFDNCTLSDSLVLRIQRLDPVSAPTTGSILYTCADADGVTQHPVKLYVKDQAGNESTCETYIVVQDNVAPVITTCPASKTIDCELSLLPNLNNNGTPVVTDNCPGITTTYVDSLFAGTGGICEVVKRYWKVTDFAANTATCVQTFSIQDTKPPTFTSLPADATISCNDALVTPQTLTATDNCTPANEIVITYAEVKTDTAVGACGQFSYKVKRTWIAEDNCGNTNSHTQNITVTDTTAPQFLGLPDTLTFMTANFPAGINCEVPVTINFSQYLSDCTADANLIITQNLTQYAPNGLNFNGTFPVGNFKLILAATDACGNVGHDTVALVIIDNSIPTAVCNNNIVVALGTNATATLQPDDIDLGSTDNCGVDFTEIAPSSFDCTDLGVNLVTLTVTDVNGNTNSCSVEVEVTLGNNSGLTVTTINGVESYFGANDGTVSATVNGGSGTYTYIWSNNATTATISGLAVGTYTVTVTDSLTSCQSIQQAVVTSGPKLTLTVGSATGAQGQMVTVPVTADRFNKVTSFSLSTKVLNLLVGVVDTILTPNPALLTNGSFSVSPNGEGVLWLKNPNAQPLSLPNGTVLFTIKINLGTAPTGSSSPVQIYSGAPAIEFTQDSAGIPVIRPVALIDGTVTINNNDFILAGDIQTWRVPTKPVKNVNVTLTGTVAANVTTGVPGTYTFSVPANASTTVSATKTTNGSNGISSADLLLIQYQIFGTPLFPSPYQWVAADVTGDRKVSLADYLLIQRVVLGTDQHLLNAPDWKFVPKAYVFPPNSTAPNPIPNGPFGPLSSVFPQTITHNPVITNYLDDDFVAIRMGDVNGNVNTDSLLAPPEDRSAATFRFSLDDRAFKTGDLVTVPFRASDFKGRQAYQMTISFDATTFALENVQPGALPGLNDQNFGTAHLANGNLTTVWTSYKPVTMENGEVLFTLTFKALRNGGSLSSVLHPSSEVTPAAALDTDGSDMKIDFDFVIPGDANATEGDFALYQNQPNPFQHVTKISFRLPESSRATVRVFNAAGQLVKMLVGDFAKGYNEANFQQSDLGAPGVYYYELETPKHSDRKKMILIE